MYPTFLEKHRGFTPLARANVTMIAYVGAIIGGLAGHYLAERGVVGAVAGCLGGRYLANRQARRREIEYGSRVQPRDNNVHRDAGAQHARCVST